MRNLQILLPQHTDSRGNLTVAENNIPFEIKRVFWITDVPVGTIRGEHLHKTCHELVVAVKGCFTLVVEDHGERCTYVMDSPQKAVWIPAGVWCRLEDWHEGTVVCVMASEKYDETGYVR